MSKNYTGVASSYSAKEAIKILKLTRWDYLAQSVEETHEVMTLDGVKATGSHIVTAESVKNINFTPYDMAKLVMRSNKISHTEYSALPHNIFENIARVEEVHFAHQDHVGLSLRKISKHFSVSWQASIKRIRELGNMLAKEGVDESYRKVISGRRDDMHISEGMAVVFVMAPGNRTRENKFARQAFLRAISHTSIDDVLSNKENFMSKNTL